MSKIEILILILASAIPLFSFVVVYKSKLKNIFKKKQKDTKKEIKEEIKQEEKPEEVVVEPIKEKSLSDKVEENFFTSDFKEYSRMKKDKITFPEMKFNSEFVPTFDLDEFDRPKPKTIAEQIKSLSPELKALIVAGVLDKKDIDNM